MEKLRKAGRHAQSQLKEASARKDREVSYRARNLLQRLNVLADDDTGDWETVGTTN